MGNFNDYATSAGDSINLSELGDKPFTIISVEQSDYEEQGKEPQKGVKITTAEEWEKGDGKKVSKIHTTRRAIVNKLLNPDFLQALDSGDTFKVKCPNEKVPSKKGGQPYYDLVSAE